MGLHAFLEAFPLSSSWHIQYFFQTSSSLTHLFHIYLIPIVFIVVAIETIEHKKILNHKKFIFFCSLPAIAVYLLIKMKFLCKIHLHTWLINLLSGLLVFIYALQQKYEFIPCKNVSRPRLWFWMGICQIAGIAISGFSRFGSSLLPALYYKMPFQESIVVSFIFDIALLMASMSFDLFHMKISTVLFESQDWIHNTLMNAIGFCSGWILLKHFKWNILIAIGSYRTLLGIFLYLGYV